MSALVEAIAANMFKLLAQKRWLAYSTTKNVLKMNLPLEMCHLEAQHALCPNVCELSLKHCSASAVHCRADLNKDYLTICPHQHESNPITRLCIKIHAYEIKQVLKTLRCVQCMVVIAPADIKIRENNSTNNCQQQTTFPAWSCLDSLFRKSQS